MSNNMSKFIKLGVLVITFAVNSAWASGSFRLDNGKLIFSGMSKTELMNVAGSPMSTETIPKINKDGEQVDSDEQILIYKLQGSIGGEHLIEARVISGKVVSLQATQSNR